MGVKVPRHFLEMVEVHRVIGVSLELDNGGVSPDEKHGHVRRAGGKLIDCEFQWRKVGLAATLLPSGTADLQYRCAGCTTYGMLLEFLLRRYFQCFDARAIVCPFSRHLDPPRGGYRSESVGRSRAPRSYETAEASE